MKKLDVLVLGKFAGQLTMNGEIYVFHYDPSYTGPAVSKTMPVSNSPYSFDRFPPFFDGLLPEGVQLRYLLKSQKIDAHDYMTQLEAVGSDLVGGVTVKAET